MQQYKCHIISFCLGMMFCHCGLGVNMMKAVGATIEMSYYFILLGYDGLSLWIGCKYDEGSRCNNRNVILFHSAWV